MLALRITVVIENEMVILEGLSRRSSNKGGHTSVRH